MNKIIWIFSLVALMTFATIFCMQPNRAYAGLEDGLVSAWKFDDGTARDYAGRNNGIIHGGVKSVSGRFKNAMDFNGKDGYIEVPDSASLRQDKFTVSAWINVRKGNNHAAIFFKGEKVGWGDHFMVRVCTTSDTNMTWGTTWAGTEGWFATDNVITTKQWYHVCMTADGSKATAYVAKDGEKPKVPPSGQTNPHDSKPPLHKFEGKPVEIGVGRAVGGTVGNDAYFDGIIDEVHFWSRALSADEVGQLAAGALPVAVEPVGKLATAWGAIKIEH